MFCRFFDLQYDHNQFGGERLDPSAACGDFYANLGDHGTDYGLVGSNISADYEEGLRALGAFDECLVRRFTGCNPIGRCCTLGLLVLHPIRSVR